MDHNQNLPRPVRPYTVEHRPTSDCFIHMPPAMCAFLLLQHAKLKPPNHSLCTGFPLPGAFFPQIFSPLRCQLTCHLFDQKHPMTSTILHCLNQFSFFNSSQQYLKSSLLFNFLFAFPPQLPCKLLSTVSLSSSPLYPQYLRKSTI